MFTLKLNSDTQIQRDIVFYGNSRISKIRIPRSGKRSFALELLSKLWTQKILPRQVNSVVDKTRQRSSLLITPTTVNASWLFTACSSTVMLQIDPLLRFVEDLLYNFVRTVQSTRFRLKAKFHYTGPTGPARTRTDFVGDPRGPNGVYRRPGPQKSPCGSGRARVVEFSYNTARRAVWNQSFLYRDFCLQESQVAPMTFGVEESTDTSTPNFTFISDAQVGVRPQKS